jgi:hypothetical protein
VGRVPKSNNYQTATVVTVFLKIVVAKSYHHKIAAVRREIFGQEGESLIVLSGVCRKIEPQPFFDSRVMHFA